MKKYLGLIISVISFVFASCNFNFQNEVQYKVLHMQQNLENDDYSVFEEEKLAAAIGTKIKVQYKDYEGFTAQTVGQQTVKEGLSVPVYYDRNLVTFSFNLAGGTGTEEVTEKFGTSTKNVVPVPVNGATRFTGWEPALPETFDKDTTFTATWNYPCYKVQYLFENADDDDYSQDENFPEEIIAGIAGKMTAVEASEVTGFVPQEIEQIAIRELADGEEVPVVTVKYDRMPITLLIDLNEGLGETKIQGKYGQTLNLEKLPVPVRTNYEFVNYEFTDASYISETFALELNNKKVLRAVWKGEGQARYVVRILSQNIYDNEYSETGKYILVGDADSETDISYDYTEIANTKYDLNIKAGTDTFAAFSGSFKPATAKTIVNKKISGDETTRIDVYVDRLEYVYKFEHGVPTDKYQEIERTSLVVRGRYGQDVYIPEFYHEGYTRNGTDWFYNRIPPAIYSGNSLEVFYAVNWNANNYTVRFDKNDSAATGTASDMACRYDTSYKPPLYANMSIRKPGYFIKEWNTKPDGSGNGIDYIKAWNSPKSNTYYETFRELTSEPDGVVTLYAQWQEIKMAEVKINTVYYVYERDGNIVLGPGENNFKVTLPKASRDYNAYFCPNSSTSGYTAGLDIITPVHIYVDNKFEKSVSEGAGDKNIYVKYKEQLTPSFTHTISFKIAMPKFDGATEPEDFITNTTSSYSGHITEKVAAASNLRVVDYDDGTMTFKWNNPVAEEVKKVTLQVGDASYEIDNLNNSGEEVTYTATGLSGGSKVFFSVKTVDGFDQSAVHSVGYIRIPDFNNTNAQKGQLYFSDGTYAWKPVANKTPVGVIFKVTGDGKPEKIFALNEECLAMRSSTSTYDYSSVKEDDGIKNWEKVKTIDTSAKTNANLYPAFKYCNEYKVAALPSLQWYLPTSSEYSYIIDTYDTYTIRAPLMMLSEIGLYTGTVLTSGHWSSTGYGKGSFTYRSTHYAETSSNLTRNLTTELYVLPVAKVSQ